MKWFIFISYGAYYPFPFCVHVSVCACVHNRYTLVKDGKKTETLDRSWDNENKSTVIIPILCLRTDTLYLHCFSQCAGSPRKLRFKFKPRSYMPYIPDEYVACVCGCDQDFLDTLDIRAITAVGPQASQGTVISRLTFVCFWDCWLSKYFYL